MSYPTTRAGSDIFSAIVGRMTQTEALQAYVSFIQNIPLLLPGELLSAQVMAFYGVVRDVIPPFLFAKGTDKRFLILLCLAYTSGGHGAGRSLISPTMFYIVASRGSCGMILTLGIRRSVVRLLRNFFQTGSVWFQEGFPP